jgi:NAD(P)-dependent dehydrogenase (short-subunit alcohol dehydrogenase family)
MQKTIFITGTSSGLGKATALYFARQGWKVAATMRIPGKETELTQEPNINIFKLDVTDVGQVRDAVAEAIAALGHIDVVVNNAGMGTYGALELATEEVIDWQFAVNVRGAINVTRAVLPHFRANGGGKFINISSLVGLATVVPLGSLYSMSKFALEGLTEGLYYELKPQNISVHLIEQGGSEDNNFVNNIAWTAGSGSDITVYDELQARLRRRMATARGVALSKPQAIVDAIYALATGESQAFRTPVGETTKMVLGMRAAMPIEEYLEKMSGTF